MRSRHDWSRIKQLGLNVSVTSLDMYNNQVVKGMVIAKEYMMRLQNHVPTIKDIQNVHYLTFKDVHPWAGTFREPGHEVAVGSVNCTESKKITASLMELENEISNMHLVADSKEKKALWDSFYHASFESIHPFPDGNPPVSG